MTLHNRVAPLFLCDIAVATPGSVPEYQTPFKEKAQSLC